MTDEQRAAIKALLDIESKLKCYTRRHESECQPRLPQDASIIIDEAIDEILRPKLYDYIGQYTEGLCTSRELLSKIIAEFSDLV